MSHPITPFQLLEVNVISAQDLARVKRNMRTYAIAWVHPDRKLYTRVDKEGQDNPTWNDKFVFRVDNKFLRSDMSAVMVEIYARNWWNDIHVGTVRVLVGNLIPPTKPHHHPNHLGMRFVALQVRRPSSGRPQGILNIGVALLDSSMRSMPLYTQLASSAVGYRDLMGEEDPHGHLPHLLYIDQPIIDKPELRRSRSDRSELERKPALDLEEELSQQACSSSMVNGSEIVKSGKKARSRSRTRSLVGGSEIGAPSEVKKISFARPSSMISGSDVGVPTKVKKISFRRASSMVSGSDFSAPSKVIKISFSRSMLNGSDIVDYPVKMGKRGKSGSSLLGISDPVEKKESIEKSNFGITNLSEVVDPSPRKSKVSKLTDSTIIDPPKESVTITENQLVKVNKMEYGPLQKPGKSPKPISKNMIEYGSVQKGGMTPKPFSKLPNFENKRPKKFHYRRGRSSSIVSDSVGQTDSELAIQVTTDEATNSRVDEWSVEDDSVEGLRSKLERWRTELPPVYDKSTTDYDSFLSSTVNGGGGGGGGGSGHVRRHTDGGGNAGLFSCFGNVYGYECSCVCGKPAQAPAPTKGAGSTRGSSGGRLHLTPSVDTLSRSYI